MRIRKRTIALIIYFILLLLPIYWMLAMSLQSTEDILGSFSILSKNITLANYMTIFTDRHHPRRSLVYQPADQRLYSPGLVGIDRFQPMVGVGIVHRSADYRHALGLKAFEFRVSTRKPIVGKLSVGSLRSVYGRTNQ